MKSESPEHVSMFVTDFGSVEKEEASSSPQKQKEKEESNENFEPNYKRVKLENDPWPSYSTSLMELDDEDKEHHKRMSNYFHYKLQLRERFSKKPLTQIEPAVNIETVEDTKNYVHRVIAKFPGLKANAPEPCNLFGVVAEQVLFEMNLFFVHETYEAVKCLYEHIPYVTCLDSEKQIREKIDLTVEPFSYFSSNFYGVVKIFKRLLSHRERLFHPLIRKSYFKDEFFKLVDEERKLEIREFLEESRRRSTFVQYFYPEQKRYYEEMSRAPGLRDEYYESCCKQIELQEEFHKHLLFFQKTKLLQSGGCIQKLIDDVDVVPEIFKELDTELVHLSLKASIEALQWYEKDTQWYTTNFKLLKEKHNNKETVELDEKLIKFCKSYPCIFDFSLNEAFDSATEEGFKDIIDEMKKNWFVGIADHYVIVATLLYMKNIYDEA
ncbi:hypothetical protein FCM35_KLT03511 [Carex littledalei]|uniref:Uncharacterized protein n=1 Tax=Carex littledalei TaxID=544730 RepID=A0A833QRS0_9POAL|nr:hypothetical protein FCM35_KLT03511 [Carex littledalei]